MVHLPKSQPAPLCLQSEINKKVGDHNCGDVLIRLQEDFKNKCYICEEKSPSSINTEHFIPHRGDNALKCDWDNLFYSCSHCNNVKLAQPEFDSILNCTKEQDKVDTSIKYEIKPFSKELAAITAIVDDQKVKNTVLLLERVYNGNTTLKKLEGANIREKLLHEIRMFQNLLFSYHSDNDDAAETEATKKEIIRHLKPSSAFTAFKRWIIRDNAWLFAEFQEYL